MSDLDAYGYDDTGQYAATCPECGTDHRHKGGPGTLQGDWECARAEIAALTFDPPLIGAVLAEMDADWERLQASMHEATFRVLRDMGFELEAGRDGG